MTCFYLFPQSTFAAGQSSIPDKAILIQLVRNFLGHRSLLLFWSKCGKDRWSRLPRRTRIRVGSSNEKTWRCVSREPVLTWIFHWGFSSPPLSGAPKWSSRGPGQRPRREASEPRLGKLLGLEEPAFRPFLAHEGIDARRKVQGKKRMHASKSPPFNLPSCSLKIWHPFLLATILPFNQGCGKLPLL